MKINYVASDRKEPFVIGDVVWISNSRLVNEEVYSASVREIIDDDKSDGNGLHYVLLVKTHVDDYLAIRKHNVCYESPDHYKDCIKRKVQY